MDFHSLFHLNSKEAYEKVHSDHWLNLPLCLEHLTTAARQHSRAPATKVRLMPNLQPWPEYALEPVQRAMLKASVWAREHQANLLLHTTANWEERENGVNQANPDWPSPVQNLLDLGWSYLRREGAFWSGFWRACQLSRQGKETPARLKSKRTKLTGRNNTLPLTDCGKETAKQLSSEMRLDITKTQRNLKMCFLFRPLKALRFFTVHHRLIQSHWVFSHLCQRRRQGRSGNHG